MNEFIREQKEEAFRIYVTDALMAISSEDQKMTRRYADIMREIYDSHVETRTEKEIITDIRGKLKAIREEGKS